MASKDKIIKKENIAITKDEMVQELKKLDLKFDISSLPDDVDISGYEINLSNPEDPVFKCTYLTKNEVKFG